MLHPFAPVDKQAVFSALRATGSHDPDVLHARKKTLLATVGLLKPVGLVLILGGSLLGVAARSALLVGVPLVLLGGWLWRRGARNVAVVEAGYLEYVRSPGS